MPTFVAIRPHDNGFFHADEVEIEGDTKEDVLRKARTGMAGGRYLSRIVALDGTTLWFESGGWTKAGQAALPS